MENSISVHLADPDSIIFSKNWSKTYLTPNPGSSENCKHQPGSTYEKQIRSEYIRPVIQRLTHTDLIPDRGVGN